MQHHRMITIVLAALGIAMVSFVAARVITDANGPCAPKEVRV